MFEFLLINLLITGAAAGGGSRAPPGGGGVPANAENVYLLPAPAGGLEREG